MAFKLFRYISATTVLLFVVLIELISQTISIDTSDYLPDYYFNAAEYNLMIAASKGYDSEVTRLLKEGADFEFTTSEGANALIFAVANNHSTTTDILLTARSDVNITTTSMKRPC